PRDRRGGLEEHEGLLGHFVAELGRVRRVVAADAHDLGGQDRREQPHVVQRNLLTRRHRVLEKGSGQDPDPVRPEIDGARRDAVAETEAHEPHGSLRLPQSHASPRWVQPAMNSATTSKTDSAGSAPASRNIRTPAGVSPEERIASSASLLSHTVAIRHVGPCRRNERTSPGGVGPAVSRAKAFSRSPARSGATSASSIVTTIAMAFPQSQLPERRRTLPPTHDTPTLR